MKTPLSKTSFFQSMFAVMRKELREVMRDRRTMMMALVLSPLLTPLLFMGIGKLGENRAKTELDKVLEVPVVGIQQAPNLMAYLATRGIKAVAAPKDLDGAIARQEVDVALELDAGFGEAWREGRSASIEIVADTTARASEVPVARVRSALEGYRDQMGTLRLMARGIDPGVVRPLSVGVRDMASAEAKRGQLAAMLLRRLDAVLSVRASKLVLFQAARDAVPGLLKLLPDAEPPTVMAIEGQRDQVALQALCRSAMTWQRLEDMKRAGATGLLVLPVEQMLQ